MREAVTGTYRDLLARLDAWFDTIRTAHQDVIPCRGGCTACCHGPFDISVADALLVRDAVVRLEPADRARVERRAAASDARMRKLYPGWDGDASALDPDRFDRLTDAMADVPCPLLDERGNCGIYPDRPLVCRMIGLGVVTPAGRVIENTCPIQDQFPSYAALPPQRFDLEALEAVEVACLEAASGELFGTPLRTGFETTVAGAVLLGEREAGSGERN